MASTYMEIPRYNSCAPVKPPVLNSMISIGNNHAVFLIQFGINLHEWVFQKAEIARAPSASAISAFWKTHKCKLIPNWTRKTVWLLINNTIMKKFVRSKCFHDVSWRHFFSHSRKLFSKIPYKIYVIALHDIIGLKKFSLSSCKSESRITMCNLHWCYTFCTGVTLFALVLHLNCTTLSPSESSNFFMRIINSSNNTELGNFSVTMYTPT